MKALRDADNGGMILSYIFVNFVLGLITISLSRITGGNVLVWVIPTLQTVYAIMSINMIEVDKKGVVTFFGRPLYERGPGFVFVPWLFCQLITVNRQKIQFAFPGNPEQIDKSGDDHKDLAPGMVRPQRITTGSIETIKADPTSKYANHPTLIQKDVVGSALNNTLTLEVISAVTLRVTSFTKMLEKLGTIEQIRNLIDEAVNTTLTAEFIKRTPALILLEIVEINDIVLAKLRELVHDVRGTDQDESWGIEIDSYQLTSPDLGKTVNAALAEASAARSKAQATIITAEAEKAALVLEAEGRQKLADVAKTPEGQLLTMAETTRTIAKEAKNILITGPGDIYGMIARGLEVWKSVSGNQTGSQPDQGNRQGGG